MKNPIIKILKIIIIWLFLFLILGLLINYILYSKQINSYNIINYLDSFKIQSIDNYYYICKNGNYFRDVFSFNNSSKKPIVIFGCSNAYGHDLEINQTLGYKLAKLSNRIVYNRAIQGFGIQGILYILNTFNLEKEIKNPEYIIYVYSACQNLRLHRHGLSVITEIPDINYIINKNNKLKLVRHKQKFINRFFIKRIYDDNYLCTRERNYEEDLKLIQKIFSETNKVIQKKFPGCKLVVFLYQDYFEDSIFYDKDRWKPLEDEGIIVIDSMELTKSDVPFNDKKYVLPHDPHHPNWLKDLIYSFISVY